MNDYGDYNYPEREFGEWSVSHSYSYEYAKITSAVVGDVVLFPGETAPTLGDTIYVVIVSYDTGNSFGREHGRHEYIAAFTNPDKAKELENFIENNQKNASKIMFDGFPVDTYVWHGYFEDYNSTFVETLTIR